MTVTVPDVMRHVRNYFVRGAIGGRWAHEENRLTPAEGFAPGMWIAITGEDAPCGVYQLDERIGISGLGDRAWQGVILHLAPPADFLRLCGEIAAWAEATPDPAVTGESLGDYRVSRRPLPWQSVFAAALRPYMRMFPEVSL